jgi:AcrR family transcriptional regulator
MARLGRPREFDRDKALEKAMNLFWKQGYEGTTLAELQKAMGGITAPSFYAAFGSKEKLFREAVALYNQVEGTPMIKALSEGATARASIESWLRAAAESFCRPDKPRGCLVVLSAVNCMPGNQEIADFMCDQRCNREKFIRQRLRRGVTEGDLQKGTDINSLASFYSTLVDGLALRANDGASRKTLIAIVERAMAAWDK